MVTSGTGGIPEGRVGKKKIYIIISIIIIIISCLKILVNHIRSGNPPGQNINDSTISHFFQSVLETVFKALVATWAPKKWNLVAHT